MKRYRTKNYASCKAYKAAPNKKQFTKCIKLLEALLDRHNRLLVCRCTLWAGKIRKNGTKIDVSKEIEKLLKAMKDKYKSNFYGHIWSLECSQEKQEHIHLTIFLNANKYQNDFTALEPFMTAWKTNTENLTQISQYKKGSHPIQNTGRVDRGDTARFDAITDGLSYLCKTSQKLPEMKRSFSMSHLASVIDPDNYRTTKTELSEAA